MSNLSIEIMVSCSWFQRRLCWMASSLLQQAGDVPQLIFNVAYPANNGSPTTEEVCLFFRKYGLNIKETVYPDERSMQFRGLVRNRQIAESKVEWALMSDCDMVYSPSFFSELGKRLETDLKTESRCISASRVSLDKDYSKNYFNVVDVQNSASNPYPRVIKEVASEVANWPVFQISRNCGAGYFQLVNIVSLKRLHGGVYVNPSECKDEAECDSYHKTRSDAQFRSLVGGLKRIELPPQYHLNHERDNEEGRHLIIQR